MTIQHVRDCCDGHSLHMALLVVSQEVALSMLTIVNNALFTLYLSYLAHADPLYCHNVPGIQEPMLIMFQVMKRDCGNVCILKIFISQEGYMVGVLCPSLNLTLRSCEIANGWNTDPTN